MACPTVRSPGASAGNAANGNNQNTGDFIYAIVVRMGSTVGVGDRQILPTAMVALEPSFPNPFGPSTTIRYRLAETLPVRLRVYDPGGRLILSLVEGEQPAGRHVARWDGRDQAGRRVASGAYLIALSAGEALASRTVVFCP